MEEVSFKLGGIDPFDGEEISCCSVGKDGYDRIFLLSGNDAGEVCLFLINHKSEEKVFEFVKRMKCHNSSVTCVSLCSREKDLFISGSFSGSLKLLNFKNKKYVQKNYLAGHRSQITCISCHPCGDYFATGSGDTNVKVWTFQERKSIQVYKSHNSEITCLNFTPDGELLVSGDAQGNFNVYNIKRSSLLLELQAHKHSLEYVCMHPEYGIFATAAKDKTVKVWDMENMSMITRTTKSSTSISLVLFYMRNEVDALFTFSSDSLRVWRYEPKLSLLDVIQGRWNKLLGCVTVGRKIIAISKYITKAQVWVFNTDKISPWGKRKAMKKKDYFENVKVRPREEEGRKFVRDVKKKKEVIVVKLPKNRKRKIKTPKEGRGEWMIEDLVERRSSSKINVSRLADEMLQDNEKMLYALSLRLTNFKMIRNLWFKGEEERIEALKILKKCGDNSLILNIMNLIFKNEANRRLITFQMFRYFLDIQLLLLKTIYEDYIVCSINNATILAKKLRAKIRDKNSFYDENDEYNIKKCKSRLAIMRRKLKIFRNEEKYGENISKNCEYLLSIINEIVVKK